MNNKLTYQILLELKDRVSAPIKALKTQFAEVDKAAAKVASTSERANTVCKRLASLDMGNMVNMLDRAGQTLQNLGGSGSAFEQSMADLSSITGIAGKELISLGQVARETGKTSGLGAKGAADAFALLASQIQVDKIGMEGLKILQKETITLAQASGMGMADAATAMAATINQFGLEAGEANRVINVLAAGSKYGAAEITDLAQSFKVTGAVAAAAGLSVEQSAGAIEVLSKSNLKGAEAGTALRNIIVKMQTTLGMDLGETGLSSALEALKPKLNDVTWLAKTFGAENLAAAQFLITNASAVDEMTTAVTGTNVAQEQAAIRTDTTAEKMKRMQASIDNVKISIFNVTGAMTPYISLLGEMMPAISAVISITQVVSKSLIFFSEANIIAKSAIVGRMIVEKAAAAVTWAMTAAQTALNAVMSANPVALIVIAIAALVAGVIAAYKNFDGFRRVVDAVWEGIKKLASVIWDGLVKAFEKVSSVLTPIWGKLKALLGIQDETVQSTEKVTAATDELGKTSETTGKTVDLLTGLLGNQGKKLNTNLATLGGIEQKISDLKTKQKEAMGDQAIALQKEIRLWEKKKEAMNNAIIIGAATPPELKTLDAPAYKGLNSKKLKTTNPKLDESGKLKVVDSGPLQKISREIDKAQSKILSFNESLFGENSVIAGWADNATSGITRITSIFKEFGDMMKNDTLTSIEKVSGGLAAMGALMGAMGGIVDGAAGSWLSWGANILAMVAAAIPQLLTLFGIQCSLAVANSASALPPPFNLIAIAATVAGIAAAVASIPKPKAFANGGIVYGNTFAQVGEYPGAANNPEVIAPLSKLRQLIQPVGEHFGKMEFRIRGNDLYAVYNKIDHANTRTR